MNDIGRPSTLAEKCQAASLSPAQRVLLEQIIRSAASCHTAARSHPFDGKSRTELVELLLVKETKIRQLEAQLKTSQQECFDLRRAAEISVVPNVAQGSGTESSAAGPDALAVAPPPHLKISAGSTVTSAPAPTPPSAAASSAYGALGTPRSVRNIGVNVKAGHIRKFEGEVAIAQPVRANGPLSNAAAARGKVVIVTRDPPDIPAGDRCSFTDKGKQCLAAGAIGMLIANTSDEVYDIDVDLPIACGMISEAYAAKLKDGDYVIVDDRAIRQSGGFLGSSSGAVAAAPRPSSAACPAGLPAKQAEDSIRLDQERDAASKVDAALTKVCPAPARSWASVCLSILSECVRGAHAQCRVLCLRARTRLRVACEGRACMRRGARARVLYPQLSRHHQTN